MEAAPLFADLETAESVILAVSGGPDSTAMLFLAARWRAARKRGPRLVAVTVDHGLRPGSAREAGMVKRLAANLNVEHRTLRWMGRKPGTGLQEAARKARYRLLVGAARRERARHILTAHTLDDQAETVLFRLVRGSGLGGLAAMTRSAALDHITLTRPFLDIPKARLVATATAAKIPFLEDPSNRDPRFARTRLRAVGPTLAREGLDARRLGLLARRLGRAERALVWATEQALVGLTRQGRTARREIVMDGPRFAELPDEIALRVLGRAVGKIGHEGPVELGKLEALLAAVLESRARRARLRRTLAGAMITADPDKVVVERAPPRKAQADKAKSARSGRRDRVKGSFTRRR